MGALLGEIESYWTNRAEGYSDWNKEELAGRQRKVWRDLICANMPNHSQDKGKNKIKILDVGTGPGFFPVILAEAGYHVNAVDYTPQMLEQAKANAGELAENITFDRMDACNLDFENESFDMLISRNLTWNLEFPASAYKEWHRVLKADGVMLNFDANWYRFLYDEDKNKEHKNDRENVRKTGTLDREKEKGVDPEKMESIARRVPLSTVDRPFWDFEVLRKIGFSEFSVDESVYNIVWNEDEKINYSSTPMFMIKAKK